MNALRVIVVLSLKAILHARRLVVAVLLGILPVLVAVLVQYVRGRVGAPTLTAGAVYRFLLPGYFHTLVILVGILFGTSVVSDDEEDGSVVYLLVRPIRRGVVYLGKTLAAILATGMTVLASLLPTWAILAFGRLDALPVTLLLKDIGWLTLGAIAYTAAFAAISALGRRPLQLSAGYLFLWEVPMAFAPTTLRYLTISHYLLSLMPHTSGWHGAVSTLGLSTAPAAACLGLAAAIVAWLALGSMRYEAREHLATTGV